ncbi:MAG: GTP-binding protein [Holophagaceae bacterium]|nr:GTP-binding protein [Holophagaceae bacterium]
MESIRPLEILLVTGPLGSGKTTVVNRLLKAEIASGRRVAVLINEFGDTSVDGSLVNAERPELAGIENLVNGCVCCSLRSDVVAALAAWCDLPADQRPQRVVLETTGLADPTDLVDLENEASLQDRLVLAGCLTVISCLTPLHHLTQRDLVQRQVALASLVYVSKADLDPSLAMAWEGEIRGRFKDHLIQRTRMGEAPADGPDPWLGDRRSLPEGMAAREGHSFADARSMTVRWDHPVDPAALEELFLRPAGQGELLRAKGVAAFDGWAKRNDGSDRWAFQVADRRVEITPLPAFADGTLAPLVAVVIGTGLDLLAWRKALRELERPPKGARRKVVL